MLKPYTITEKFFYNTELKKHRIYTRLLDSPYEEEMHYGTDFEGLWDLTDAKMPFIPLWAYETEKGKRYMKLNDAIFSRITENNCKSWKYVISCCETTITMDELMKFETEDVMRYLKERGMNTCPLKGE